MVCSVFLQKKKPSSFSWTHNDQIKYGFVNIQVKITKRKKTSASNL